MINYKIIGDNSESIVDVVLNNRNLTISEVEEIVNPSIEEYDGMLLKNMQQGIDLLSSQITKPDVIGILVDPDNDGFCAAAEINEFITNELNHKNVKHLYHTKKVKSHGVDEEIYEEIINQKIQFVVITDAGSTKEDYEMIKKLHDEHGVKFLIIDHHMVEYTNNLQNVVLINHNQPGCKYPNKHLSGAAITYKFIQTYSKAFQIDIGNKYVDLAALSLISDMMDMKSLENRVIFNKGSLRKNITSPLLEMFIHSKKLAGDYLTIEQCGFAIAPLINSTIRSENQEDKELLFKSFYSICFVPSNKRGNQGAMENIQEEIIRRMGNIKSKNDKEVKSTTEKAHKYIEEKGLINDKVLMIDVTKLINSGQTGLLANKLISAYKRPIFLYRDKENEEGFVGGSCRGLKVKSFKDICLKSGLFEFCSGHDNSFGHTIRKDKLEALKTYFNDSLSDLELEEEVVVDAAYRIEVPFEDVKQIAEFKDLWCKNISEPTFIIKDVQLDTSNIMKIGNAEYVFRLNNTSYNKKFCSLQWIEDFTKQNIEDKKAKYPFKSSLLLCDLVARFRQNEKGYYYIDIIDGKSKLL